MLTPRPILTDAIFEQTLKNWLEKHYSKIINDERDEMGDDFDITKTGLYESIDSVWSNDNELTAEYLVRYNGWSFEDAQEFVDNDLESALDKHLEQLEEEWVKQNKLTPPFATGTSVKFSLNKNGIIEHGIIQPDENHRYAKFGKSLVLTDEHKKLNEQNTGTTRLGTVVNWEDLELA